MLGVLARRLGDLDRAEEALQEALAEALKHWPDEGVPATSGRLAGHHGLAQGARPAAPRGLRPQKLAMLAADANRTPAADATTTGSPSSSPAATRPCRSRPRSR